MEFLAISMMILGLLIYSTAVTHAKSNIDDFCKNKTYGSACQKENKPGVCVQGMCFLGFKPTPQPTLIKIRYPQGNEYVRNSSFDGGEMFLRGDGLGLTWTRGRKMRKLTTSDTWELELQFAIPGYELPTENKPAARFEFRVYLEDSLDMLGPNFVIALPLSTNAGNSSKTAEFWRYPWFFSKEGSIVKRNVYSPEMRDTYEIVVSLPPSFRENTYKRYEVLIVNDGQRLDMLLPQLKVLMLERALIKEIVLVGIANDYRNRTRLLAVSNGSELACLNGGDLPVCNGCLKCNSSTCDYEQLVDDYRRCYMWVRVPKYFGQLYLDFIQNTIIPDSARKYRTLPGAENVGILGFSLGGLMACHAIWTRPQTFGSAACMSPSLWWPFPQNATFPDDAGYEFTTSTLLQHRGARPRQKIYIDVGGREGYLMISPAKNATKILESTPYFERNKNLWFYIWEGQYHTFVTAVQRMWIPLIAFYGTEGSPQADIIKTVVVINHANKPDDNRSVFLTLCWTCLMAHIISLLV